MFQFWDKDERQFGINIRDKYIYTSWNKNNGMKSLVQDMVFNNEMDAKLFLSTQNVYIG